MVQLPHPDEGRDTVRGMWGGESIEIAAHRVIVKFKARPDAPLADAEGLMSMAAGLVVEVDEAVAVVRPPGATRRAVMAVAEDADVTEVAMKLNDRDDVEYAEPDVIDHAAILPNDTRLPDQWSLPKVNAFAAWDLETGDPGVVIGVIDSGISMSAGGVLDHPDLNDASRIILGTDFVDGGTPRDLNGHGTHVAGIAAGLGNNATGIAGVAWTTRLYICRTLATNGNGSSADFADAVEEIVDYAVANGLKAVINYSGGGPPNQTKLDACNYASTHGMLLCAATGNDDHGPVIWPAAYSTTVSGVIAVGSTDQADNVSSFSNVGPEVTVVAPGTHILSSTPTYSVFIPGLALNYDFLDGTSMATPLVSGLAALMWSRHIGFTNVKIKDCLTSTAVKLGPAAFDNAWGHGRVDAEAALRCGDIVVVPTLVGPTCQPSRIVATCPSVVAVRCPSRPPVLCPTSRLPIQCPSRPPVLCPTTRVPIHCGGPSVIPATCPVVSQIGCPVPSRVGCPVPSQIGCPGPGPIPERGPLATRGAEQWYGAGDYFLYDDAGNPQPFPPESPATADTADWYWLDDQGNMHYWSGDGS